MHYTTFLGYNSNQLFGLSFISKFPIFNLEYKLLPSINKDRAIVSIIAISPYGEIKLYNTHFDTHTNPEIRSSQAQTLINYISDFNDAIILGDFNTGPFTTDEAFNLLNSSYNDSWILSGRNSVSNIDPLYNSTQRIDYIWIKGNYIVKTNSFNIFGTSQSSDHVGLYVDLLF